MALASHFHHPLKHFPGLVRRVEYSSVGACALFKDLGGDEGLRAAARFFWNLKTLRVVISIAGGPNVVAIGQDTPGSEISFEKTCVDSWHPAFRATVDDPDKLAAANPVPYRVMLRDEWDGTTEQTIYGSPYDYLRILTVRANEILYLTDKSRYAVQLYAYVEGAWVSYSPTPFREVDLDYEQRYFEGPTTGVPVVVTQDMLEVTAWVPEGWSVSAARVILTWWRYRDIAGLQFNQPRNARNVVLI